MKTRAFLILFLSVVPMLHLLAQSTNINCATALDLGDVTSYCSGEEEFDSEDVGGSEFEAPDCWADAQNDLWFSFTAANKSINIIASGTVGSMDNPEIALYKGEDCSFITEVNCIVNSNTDDITTIFESNLIIGEQYFIRVDGRTNGNDGTFQLCIESFNPPIQPGQDCNTASILCSKEAFVVQNIEGNGAITDEADGTCLDVGGGSENNSTWFKWTCGVSGTLTMDLIPLVITDDYDFAIFELNGDLESCDKILLRCNSTDGGDLEPCGPNTGLDLISTDTEEDQNCDAGEDGYLRFINLQAGTSYAMLINNFSDSEAGFSLSFGGTAEFEGPTADFEVGFDECGPIIQVESTSLAGSSDIVIYEWDFGSEALPPFATGPGPHQVIYPDLGLKNITLRVESELGCQIFYSEEVLLEACSYLDELTLNIDSLGNIGCGETNTGYLSLQPSVECGTYEYSIDGGPVQSVPIFENLSAGEHTISIQDENGCTKDSMYFINEVADFTVSAGDDVTIEDIMVGIQLDAMTTAATDVTVSWSPSTGVTCADGSTNCLNPQIDITEETTFTITVIDENGCVATDEITVSVNLCGASLIALSIDSLRSNTCVGDSTGFIQVSGVDGEPGYLFSINEGGFSEDSTFDSLPAGDYIVTVQDMNGCTAGLVIQVNEAPDFTLEAGPDITLDLPGDIANPAIETSLSSGFTVEWSPSESVSCSDGTTNCLNPSIVVAETTTFTITINDDGGCVRSDMLTVIVPDVCANSDLAITVDSLSGEYCNGAESSYLGVSGVSGFPDYLYNINGGAFDNDSIFTNLAPGTYTIGVQDRFNCISTTDVIIEQLPPFVVSAGGDVETNGTEPFPSLNGSHTSLDDISISWSPASGLVCPDSSSLNCLNPLVNPAVTTTYTMTVTDARGCVVSDQVTVRVFRNEEVYGPNIFTPNEDGIHDFFTLQADPDIVEVIEDLTIFDRWGNKVYEGRNLSPADPNSGWNGQVNGQAAEQGVYVWFATIKFVVPSQEPGAASDTKIVKGDVALIR